jgi:hypothetical protein
MTAANTTWLTERIRRLFRYLEARGSVLIVGPDEHVSVIRPPTLVELDAAVQAAGLPPPHGGLWCLHRLLFDAPPPDTQ